MRNVTVCPSPSGPRHTLEAGPGSQAAIECRQAYAVVKGLRAYRCNSRSAVCVCAVRPPTPPTHLVSYRRLVSVGASSTRTRHSPGRKPGGRRGRHHRRARHRPAANASRTDPIARPVHMGLHAAEAVASAATLELVAQMAWRTLWIATDTPSMSTGATQIADPLALRRN